MTHPLAPIAAAGTGIGFVAGPLTVVVVGAPPVALGIGAVVLASAVGAAIVVAATAKADGARDRRPRRKDP